MKYLAKKTGENVRAYQSIGNKGVEILDTIESVEDFYNKISNLEDSDFYPQEDGIVLDGSENEVYDPKYPETFDFTDYTYSIVDGDSLDDYHEAHIINAIDKYENE